MGYVMEREGPAAAAAGPFYFARRSLAVSIGVTASHREINLGGFIPQVTYQYARQFSMSASSTTIATM
ncbi:hypothetical protein GCM10010862_00780 [Devosia nitrariae]|uniref:Uncharacterized protein n=1 Tax=Devosia nitrariae TaxID=2071872 RepID=A0ABQ5VYE3_9HYPH|nr:hypothetical protein GCM10010862_00780 [Devosia nitrariae]